MMMERLLGSPADIEPLLDTAAAAEWLTAHGVHMTPTTLRKLRRSGGGPQYRRLNRRPYYTATDLRAWFEASEPSDEELDQALAGLDEYLARTSYTNPW